MFLCLEYTEVGDDTLHFCKGAQLKPLSWCCRWIKAFIMSTQALNVKLIKCSERWTFHVSWWTLEQLSSGFFWKNVHLWGKRNPAELNWESPLHRVCFVYFTAHLITPAVNICLYASSQVFMTLKATTYEGPAACYAAVIFSAPWRQTPSNSQQSGTRFVLWPPHLLICTRVRRSHSIWNTHS